MGAEVEQERAVSDREPNRAHHDRADGRRPSRAEATNRVRMGMETFQTAAAMRSPSPLKAAAWMNQRRENKRTVDS